MKCYVVDDEPSGIELLERFIKRTDGLEFLGSSLSPVAAFNELTTNHIDADLLFLDIDMPDIPGTEFSKIFNGEKEVIFCTGHFQYAVEAFTEDVVDYLLKPITYERFLKAITKARTRMLYKKMLREHKNDCLQIHTGGMWLKLNYQEIIYIESLKDCLLIHPVFSIKDIHDPNAKDKPHYNVYISLTKMIELLPSDQFVRVHKSFIVNINKIRHYDSKSIVLTDQHTLIPIGANYLEGLLAVLKNR